MNPITNRECILMKVWKVERIYIAGINERSTAKPRTRRLTSHKRERLNESRHTVWLTVWHLVTGMSYVQNEPIVRMMRNIQTGLNEKTVQGLISGVSPDISNNDICDDTGAACPNKMSKGTEDATTTSVLIIFDGLAELFQLIRIGWRIRR